MKGGKIQKIISSLLSHCFFFTFTSCAAGQGPQGEIGPQGPQGEQGIQGPQGVQGIQGPQGVQGPQGESGSSWLSGWTMPLNSEGKNGDMYLDTTSRDIYQKVNGAWKWIANLQGKEVKQKWDDDGELKILAIGNSFSDDALWLLPDVLKDLGITKFRISNLYIGGCVLETHLNNIKNNSAAYEFRTNTGNGWSTVKETKLIDGVNADDWDYITFQQGSSKSGIADSYSFLTEIIDTVEALKPQAKLAWHMTWAYQKDATLSAFGTYNNDQTKMYNAIINSVKSEILDNYDIHFIIPNGTMVQNARTSFLGDTLTRDGFHLTKDIGRYAAALSYAYLMTGYSIDNVTYVPSGVSEEVKKVCIESVKNAVMKPYTVTQSVYNDGEEEPSLEDDYVQMAYEDYGWTDLAYWNSTYTNGKHYEIDTKAANAKNFVCTKMFTRAELPVGSIIEIDAGYQYRPEGWIGTESQPSASRPASTSVARIVIDEAWWGEFDTRAFNICKKPTADLTGATAAAKAAFRIWLPK